MANALLVFNRNPYDGTDVTWNGLRLAEQLLNAGLEVNIFLMNDSVDLARDATKAPEGYFDLGKMLKELIARGVPVKVCGTCKARCGIHKGEPYFEGAHEAKMTELAQWFKEADKIISF
ncbi:MAG: DsrE family protein [Sedimentisphaerales bacterium]|nr:DsrE family protein [Sedimentisphaerales bacterium]